MKRFWAFAPAVVSASIPAHLTYTIVTISGDWALAWSLSKYFLLFTLGFILLGIREANKP